MRHIIGILIVIFAVGCTQLPPKPQDIQAKKFEAVPGKAVIYIVRPLMDSPYSAVIFVGNRGMIGTHAGTYLRWEAEPGLQRIEGAGLSTASVTIPAEAGKVYFVEQTVFGNKRDGSNIMSLRLIDDTRGKSMVTQAEML